jgi:hypothetical protein
MVRREESSSFLIRLPNVSPWDLHNDPCSQMRLRNQAAATRQATALSDTFPVLGEYRHYRSRMAPVNDLRAIMVFVTPTRQ